MEAQPENASSSLNQEQRSAVEHAQQGRNIFLTGSGGVGKSYCLSHMIDVLQAMGKTVAVTATTGVASTRLPNASTLHSFMGVGLGLGALPELIKQATIVKPRRERLRGVDTLVIDEISMIDPLYFCKMDLILRCVRFKFHVPFGGVQLIVSGDFLQLPSVGQGSFISRELAACARAGSRDEMLLCSLMRYPDPLDHAAVSSYRPPGHCFDTKSWEEGCFQFVELRQVQRQSDAIFIAALEEIRFGRCPPSVNQLFASRLLAHPDDTTVLHPRKEAVAKTNEQRLKALVASSKARVAVFNCKIKPEKFRDSKTELPCEQRLELCVGAKVLMLINKYREKGIWNGSSGVVEGFSLKGRNPVVRFSNGRVVEVETHKWKLGERVTIEQIPLALGWAISIHKAQGLTLDSMVVDAGRSIFESGQTYVALSRCRSLDALFLTHWDPRGISVDQRAAEFYRSNRLSFSDKIDVTPSAVPPAPVDRIPDVTNAGSASRSVWEEDDDLEDLEAILTELPSSVSDVDSSEVQRQTLSTKRHEAEVQEPDYAALDNLLADHLQSCDEGGPSAKRTRHLPSFIRR